MAFDPDVFRTAWLLLLAFLCSTAFTVLVPLRLDGVEPVASWNWQTILIPIWIFLALAMGVEAGLLILSIISDETPKRRRWIITSTIVLLLQMACTASIILLTVRLERGLQSGISYLTAAFPILAAFFIMVIASIRRATPQRSKTE